MTYVFLGGQTLKLIKNGINITNSSNPLILTKNITIIDCYSPPLVRLTAQCIVASIASPNLVPISSAIYLVIEIYEEC